MKIILLFLFTGVAGLNLHSQQSYNKGFHLTSEIACPMAIPINGSYYSTVSRIDNNGPYGACYLYKYSSNGILTSAQPILAHIQPRINQAFKTLDNHILLISEDYKCMPYDLILDTAHRYGYITKIDTSGNIIFHTRLNRSYPRLMGDIMVRFLDGFNCGMQNADHTYVTFSDSTMFKFSGGGSFLFKVDYPFDSIHSALLLPNNNILLSVSSGTSYSLTEISQAAGSIVSTKTFTSPLEKMVLYDGQKKLALSSSGILYKISQGNSLIASSNFSSASKVRDFIYENNIIYSVLAGALQSAAYSVDDTSFVSLHYTAIPTRSLNPVVLCKSGSQVAMFATGTSNYVSNIYSGHNHFSSISLFDKLSAPVYSKNVSLSAVETATAYSTISYVNGNYTGHNLYLKIKFRVKNPGSTPLSSFKLNCETGVNNGSCDRIIYHQQLYSGLNLQPGDSINLQTATINKFATIDNLSSFPQVPTNHCVFLTLPDGEIDSDPSTNQLCYVENFNGLSVNQFDLDADLKIFPNPVENIVTIESGTSIMNIVITNNLGATVEENAGSGQSMKVDLKLFPPGIYFIKLNTKNQTIIKKVIKL